VTAEERQVVLEFLRSEWPPSDAQVLYSLGSTAFKLLGKQAALRAVLAAYEAGGRRTRETEYDRLARRAAETWVIAPTEENRLAAGRIASSPAPSSSGARSIANIAGRNRRWPSAIGVNLTGNYHFLSADSFTVICAAIHQELLAWSTWDDDPVANRHARDAQST
jgi:hypothetical protein